MQSQLRNAVVLACFSLSGALVPAQASIAAVFAAKATVSPKTHIGKCPKKFNFKGQIFAKRAGRVQYRWIRSDGANSPVKTLHFTTPGVKGVATTWTLGGPTLKTYNGWQAIQIVYPHKVQSNKAHFRLRCRQRAVPRPRRPDLTVRFSAPAVAYAGENIGPKLKVAARNIGHAKAKGTDIAHSNGYMIDITLGKDTKVPAGYATYSPSYSEDVLLKGGRISNTKTLAPGALKLYGSGGVIPKNTPAGMYFICAKVDSGEKIAELRETNNVACRRIKIKRRLVIGRIPPRVIFKEDCVGFNYATTVMKKFGSSWRLVDGNHSLHSFSKKKEAARSLKIIKRYRANRHCFVGRPGPSLHYILNAAGAPSGAMAGEDCVAFNPATVQAKKIKGDWKVVDGSHWMFSFGSKANEAKLSALIIKKYKFNRSCFVGRPGASFTYMRR